MLRCCGIVRFRRKGGFGRGQFGAQRRVLGFQRGKLPGLPRARGFRLVAPCLGRFATGGLAACPVGHVGQDFPGG